MVSRTSDCIVRAYTDSDTDQLLNTHRAMTNNAEHLSAALARSATESASYLAQHKTFAEAIKDFQKQLMTDLEQERRGARSIFSTFANEVQAEYHSIFNKMFGTASSMAQKVDNINLVNLNCFHIVQFRAANLLLRTSHALPRRPSMFGTTFMSSLKS